MALSNEELFAKAYHMLWMYEQDLPEPLSDIERARFIQDFVRLEQENAARFRL